MKKIMICFLLGICTLMMFTANAPFESDVELETNSQEIDTSLTDDVKIVDIFGTYDMAYVNLDGDEECFYRDEKYEYYMHPEKKPDA